MARPAGTSPLSMPRLYPGGAGSSRNAVFRSVLRIVAGLVSADNLRMQRFQSYKFRLSGTTEQGLQMRKIAGCCRFVFNRALALQQQRRSEGRTLLGVMELSLLLAAWRRHRHAERRSVLHTP
jgi:Helix-turn-helix domain